MKKPLNGHQLKSLLEFVNPDGENDLDQLETELTIKFFEDGHSGKGYYFWMTEYPEEGAMKLDIESGAEG
ncbi:hypothetical protein [Acinetobacter oleivorans]|uniref:hypothetical protein n=1 Tax=Acinetobacter oleivorans TaxID=1148157 RepID=UPI00124C7D77|nr:hypothetical protein [Acinetobacter oleivorans]